MAHTHKQTDRQTDRQTDGHGDSMTDPAQRAESVKILSWYMVKPKSRAVYPVL